MSQVEFPTVPQTVGQPRIVKTGQVLVSLRWQRWHDGWRNTDRDLRWYGSCITCGRNVWAFDDGENDPRGALGDNALWSVSEEGGPQSRTCAICANEYDLYEQARRIIERRPAEEWAALEWPSPEIQPLAGLEAEMTGAAGELADEMAARAETRRYRIVRRYFSDDMEAEVIDHGLTLEEAQAHCQNPETSSSTATSAEARERMERFGSWFDSFEEE